MNKSMPALLLSFGLLGCGPTMAQFNTLKGNVNQNSDSIRSLEKATDRLKNHLDYNDATSEFNEYIQMRAPSSEKHLSMFIAQMTKKMTTLSGIYMGLIESNPSDPIKLDCYYKLAQVYDRMASALLNIPVPRGLSPNEQEFFKRSNAQKAAPLRDNAKRCYQAMVGFAEKVKINNITVENAKYRLKKLE